MDFGAHKPSAATASVHVRGPGGSCPSALPRSVFRAGVIARPAAASPWYEHNPRAATASVHASARGCLRPPARLALLAGGRAAGAAAVSTSGVSTGGGFTTGPTVPLVSLLAAAGG